MGCGASSLKGDDVSNVNSQPVAAPAPGGQPLKKVKTDFSSVDYEQGVRQRRLTEYAPHEQPEPVTEESHDFSAEQQGGFPYDQQQYQNNDGIISDRPDYGEGAGPGTGADAMYDNPDATLKPYQTFDGGDWNNNDGNIRQAPYVNGTQNASDPTSNLAKDEFATANDPANPLNQESHLNSTHQAHHARQADFSDATNDLNFPSSYSASDVQTDGNGEHKKSWLGQKYTSFQSAKRGTGPSDEDVMKYTGKDRQELNEWARDRPGVGGNQDAGRVGTDSGMQASAAWN